MHPSLFIGANSAYNRNRQFGYHPDTSYSHVESNQYVEYNWKYHYCQPWLAWPNMPTQQPIEPHSHDVLLGRGGRNNQHSGNDILRQLGRLQGENYRVASKKGKSALSRLLVRQMRELDPPARFLRRVQQTATWEEVSEETAREKASQVLRDAVTGLLEKKGDSEDEAVSIVPLPSVSAPISVDEHDLSWQGRQNMKKRLDFYPPIEYEATGTERKRHRYETEATDDVYSSTRQDLVGCSPLRRQTEVCAINEESTDRAFSRHTRRKASGQSKECTSTGSNTGLHIGKLDEFALLHGELLDSDVEDESSVIRDRNDRLR